MPVSFSCNIRGSLSRISLIIEYDPTQCANGTIPVSQLVTIKAEDCKGHDGKEHIPILVIFGNKKKSME